MYKFNASFRKSTYAVATEMGLEFISTKRQVENGTLMFYDPRSRAKYALYESGYVRRLNPAMYQLNKTRKVTHQGSKYVYQMTERIKANPEEQLGIFVKSIVNYRNKTL